MTKPRNSETIFCVFAIAYLLSSLVRGVTATLAPALTEEFGLNAGELGLLAGAYFLGFATLQLPLGHWLDRFGPRRVLATSLFAAALSCVGFAAATSFAALFAARLMGGIGVSACLIAPLTAARLWLPKDQQQGVNAWMLLAGAVGLLAATVPVQWLLPLTGWRPIFLGLAGLFALVWIGVLSSVPAHTIGQTSIRVSLRDSYKPIFKDPYFRRIAPVGFFNYGTLVAVQTLWAGPWLTEVAGYTSKQAASGLFGINMTMLVVFLLWGHANPKIHRRGISSEYLMALGLPLGFGSLAIIACLGSGAGWVSLSAFCALSSFLALTHPAVGMAFPQKDAGKAISAFNLLLFVGVFVTQWAAGAFIDQLLAIGWKRVEAFRLTFAILAACSGASYWWFMAHDSGTHEAVAVKEIASG